MGLVQKSMGFLEWDFRNGVFANGISLWDFEWELMDSEWDFEWDLLELDVLKFMRFMWANECNPQAGWWSNWGLLDDTSSYCH